MARVLVTGANGLIGANLVRELLYDGHEVRALVRPTSDMRSLAGLEVNVVYGDVLEADTLDAALSTCDMVYHTAAVFTYWGDQAQLEKLAIEGTRNVIDAAHRAGITRVVVTSSSVVFGSSSRPLVRNEQDRLDDQESAHYIHTKDAQERSAFEYADYLGLELIAVCPTMSVGPHGYRLGPSNGAIVAYLSDVLRPTFPGGCNIVSVKDVARGHIIAGAHGQPGERYCLGSENLEWSEIHRIISELCGLPEPYWNANHTISYLAASAYELTARLTRKPPLTTRTQARMVGRYYWYDHKKASALGYRPRPARRALAEAVAWLASSEHISRQVRTTLRLSREVYDARKADHLMGELK